jgi:branched-chain amino acid transport system substrate-binding protein
LPLRSRFIVIVLATTLLGACGRDHSPVLIGVAGPFGQTRGVSMRNGAELAVREINRAGGVRGRRLELVFADDSADANVAARIARRFRDTPGLVAVVGHLTSGTTIAAAPIYNGGLHPLVQVSPTASSPELTGIGPYSFRICPTDRSHGVHLADFALTVLSTRRAAVIYENDDYGRGVRDAFHTAFRERGGEVVTEDPYLMSLPTFDPYLVRARRAGANVVLVAGTAAGAMRVLSTMDSLGLGIPVLGTDGLVGMSPSPDWQTRVFVSSAYLPDQPGPANQTFVQAYRAAHGNTSPDHRAAGTYDAIQLLAAAIASTGLDRDKIRTYLQTLGRDRPSYAGVTGSIAFNDGGDRRHPTTSIATFRNGQLVTAARP